MKLLQFRAGPYRNARPVLIDFARGAASSLTDQGCSIRFLVGPNGVGKSAVMRFLAAIFAATEARFERPAADDPAYVVKFTLSYELNGQHVEIDSAGTGRTGVVFRINSEAYPAGEVPSLDLVLPFAILAYTAGDLTAWRQLLKPRDADGQAPITEALPMELVSDESLLWEPLSTVEASVEEPTLADQRLRLIEPAQMPLALLAVLLAHASEGAGFEPVLDRLGLTGLVHFSLVVSPDQTFLNETDRDLLGRLFDAASLIVAPAADEPRLWLYDLDSEGHVAADVAKALVAEGGHAFLLFRELDRLLRLGILAKVNLVLEKRRPGGELEAVSTLLLTHLSDGEANYLQRMALIHLLPAEESLFLLDEPETHFNDAWKRGVIDHLEHTLKGTCSQVLLTTHDSLTLTDAFESEVVLLGPEGQRIVPLTLATDPGEILRSVYDADATVGARGLRLVEVAKASGDPELIADLLRHVGPGLQRSRLIEMLD